MSPHWLALRRQIAELSHDLPVRLDHFRDLVFSQIGSPPTGFSRAKEIRLAVGARLNEAAGFFLLLHLLKRAKADRAADPFLFLR